LKYSAKIFEGTAAMEESSTTDTTTSCTGRQTQEACEHMIRELVEGIRHGFFEMTVTVEIMQSKKRCITIKAGKSLRFIV
jgi:hypothetical protein